MTHPTKAIVSTLLRDFISVSRGGADEGLYNVKDLDAALARTQVIDFHQTLDLDGIKARPYDCSIAAAVAKRTCPLPC